MALYDDLDTKQKTDQIDGWSSGIKLLQSQLAVKKVVPQRNVLPRKATTLAPVIDLKAKKDLSEDTFKPQNEILRLHPAQVKSIPQSTFVPATIPPPESQMRDSSSDGMEWNFVDEYDPMWPNDYEKLVKVKRDKEREKLREREERKREERSTKRKIGGSAAIPSRAIGAEDASPPAKYMGFGGRPAAVHSDDEETYSKSPPSAGRASMGAAIAPPPSLQENLVPDKSAAANVAYGASSVAAKIMAKYGFKDGQGLGKQEQGMAVALQVEKTSKRGGRIIHEKEFMMPPPTVPSPPPPQTSAEPSITEIMKSPSKVVLLRNMVGPGDVDSELEPEVKDECNTKYGDVVTVVIHEIPDTNPEEAVRIFVEFKRIESAIKAVVDLNGRFFGGRQVKAGFYDFEKFQSLQLLG